MGLNVVSKRTGLALVGLALAAAGCQPPPQGTAPLRLSVMSEQVTPAGRGAGKDAPYINADFHETDDSSDGIFLTAVNGMGSAVSMVFSPVVAVSQRSIQWLASDRPSTAYQLMEDRNSADNRREGMNRLADFGFLQSANFRKRVRQIAQHDPDATVRATAIRTANRARDGQATPLFIKGLNDSSEWVRLESAKALANVPDVNAADSLVRILNNHDESRDIRVAAADALKHYRTLTVARSLSYGLDDKNFAISWQSRRSLRYLTDKDFGFDSSAWLAYFTGPDHPLG